MKFNEENLPNLPPFSVVTETLVLDFKMFQPLALANVLYP